jgi:AcrR family transcriptional regulator
VLDAALQVFWTQGYEATSLDDLTAAMGINRPSLYAAFGNKEKLFRTVVDRYVAESGKALCEALSAPTARETVERLLTGAAGGACGRHARGCMLVQGALAGSAESEPIRKDLASKRAATEVALRARFERAITDGDLPRDADPAGLARYVTTVLYGLSIQSAGGATREQLVEVVAVALRAFPPSPIPLSS